MQIGRPDNLRITVHDVELTFKALVIIKSTFKADGEIAYSPSADII